MAPKASLPEKRKVLVLKWFRDSGCAHALKELEKALPASCGISGMQVKDYLQNLSDEGQIHVEKIGSGNWYWSFAGEEVRLAQAQLARAKKQNAIAEQAVADISKNLEDVKKAREDMEGDEGGDERVTLTGLCESLGQTVTRLTKELSSYADNDPIQLEERRRAIAKMMLECDAWTEEILIMEDWLRKQMDCNPDQMTALVRDMYGVEFDEEDCTLKDLPNSAW